MVFHQPVQGQQRPLPGGRFCNQLQGHAARFELDLERLGALKVRPMAAQQGDRGVQLG